MIRWRKSSHSQGQGEGECVEVARVAETALIRDSKNPDGPHLELPRPHLRDLIADVKTGKHDTES
jgi:hypothetical protein